MKKRKVIFIGALLFFFCLPGKTEKKGFPSARKSLEKTLQNYRAPSLMIPLRQDIFLSILKTNLTSEGRIFLQGRKFRLDLKGNPSSLSLFDGEFFWHQPDLKEKIVFKIKKASQIQKLNSFFDMESLFELFELKGFVQRNQSQVYEFQPKEEIQGLKELFMKTDQKRILEIRFIWEDLNTWQKYTFSKPVVKKLPSSLFEWTKTDHRILKKEDF